MAQKINGRWFEGPQNWYPVIVVRPTSVIENLIGIGCWLNEHCADGPEDYEAYTYDDQHTIYFFRDPEVAVWFKLRW